MVDMNRTFLGNARSDPLRCRWIFLLVFMVPKSAAGQEGIQADVEDIFISAARFMMGDRLQPDVGNLRLSGVRLAAKLSDLPVDSAAAEAMISEALSIPLLDTSLGRDCVVSSRGRTSWRNRDPGVVIHMYLSAWAGELARISFSWSDNTFILTARKREGRWTSRREDQTVFHSVPMPCRPAPPEHLTQGDLVSLLGVAIRSVLSTSSADDSRGDVGPICITDRYTGWFSEVEPMLVDDLRDHGIEVATANCRSVYLYHVVFSDNPDRVDVRIAWETTASMQQCEMERLADEWRLMVCSATRATWRYPHVNGV